MSTPLLYSPVRLSSLELRNRVVMAPMTRSRAGAEGAVNELIAEYYRQRSGAGLIITEGTYPSAMGKGYLGTPGIHSEAQVSSWKQVTDAVHQQGSKIFCQIMHAGRISHPDLLPGGALPVAPSAIAAEGQAWTPTGQKKHPTPRALENHEIAGVIEEYATATKNALRAGFDGVELHSASGYLPEQFLSSETNHRTDSYGGSIHNRVRFVVEALDAMIREAGPGKVGIKISPEMGFNDCRDATPRETYTHLVRELAKRPLAYLHVALFGAEFDYHSLFRSILKEQGATFAYLVGGGLKRDSAEALISEGRADLAVFGSPFISNPDLVERLQKGWELTPPDQATFYQGGARGYVDYPKHEA